MTEWIDCTYGKCVKDMSNLDEYYRGQYRKEHPVIVKVAKARAEFIKKLLPDNVRVLDVGCGNGYLLDMVDGDGVEPNGGERYKDISEVGEHYDWIVCSHVIEHVLDPLWFLKTMKSLADNFIFIVPLDNYNEPHLWAFSREGFDRLVREVGYKIEDSGLGAGGYWVKCD